MTDAQKWLVFGGIILGGWVLYQLAPVLTPFAIAALLAYLGDPIVDRMQKLRLSRTFSVMVVFAIMLITGLVLLLVLIPLIEQQLYAFVRSFPEFINWLQGTLLPRLAATFKFNADAINLEAIKEALVTNWQDVGNIASTVVIKITQSGQVIFLWIAWLLLIPVVTFYLLRDWDHLLVVIRELIPPKHAPLVIKLAHDCDLVLSEFLRGQLLVMLGQGIIYSVGLWIVGLEFALLAGMLAGLVSFVPYLEIGRAHV